MTQKFLVKLYWLSVSPQHSLTNPFGAAVPAAMGCEIQPVLTGVGGGVQLRLNQLTWLLSTPLTNPLRGSGATGASALPETSPPFCPTGRGKDGTPTGVEVWGHPRGGWEQLGFSGCTRAGVAGRA